MDIHTCDLCGRCCSSPVYSVCLCYTDQAKVAGEVCAEYRELADRAGRLRDMLQRYAYGTLGFEPACPITLLSRQLNVMDEYALILRRRANIEHISLGYQRIDTAARDTR